MLVKSSDKRQTSFPFHQCSLEVGKQLLEISETSTFKGTNLEAGLVVKIKNFPIPTRQLTTPMFGGTDIA